MADEASAATETNTDAPKGEVRGTLLGADEISDWGRDTIIVEKNPVTEDGKEVGPAETETEPEAATEEPVEEAVVPELVTEPVATPAVEDPGQYAPGDYSFEVNIFDSEGKNPRSRKINSVEEWDALLDSDPNFGNATALLRAQRAATKMETALDRDQATYNERKAAYDEYVATEEARTAATDQIANEINYLVDRGELPSVAPEFVNADWSDPKIAAQPGVKEQVALLAYMQKENVARGRAGLAPMTSALDAWNAYQLDQAKQTNQTRAQQAAQQRREAGARVASTSPAPGSAAPRGIAVGRGGSLDDLGAQNWST